LVKHPVQRVKDDDDEEEGTCTETVVSLSLALRKEYQEKFIPLGFRLPSQGREVRFMRIRELFLFRGQGRLVPLAHTMDRANEKIRVRVGMAWREGVEHLCNSSA